MFQLYKLSTGGLCLGCFFINLLLKLRKIICGCIAGSGSFEVFDGSPVLQTGAVLEFISGCVNEYSACTGFGDDIFLWYLDPLFLFRSFCGVWLLHCFFFVLPFLRVLNPVFDFFFCISCSKISEAATHRSLLSWGSELYVF